MLHLLGLLSAENQSNTVHSWHHGDRWGFLGFDLQVKTSNICHENQTLSDLIRQLLSCG